MVVVGATVVVVVGASVVVGGAVEVVVGVSEVVVGASVDVVVPGACVVEVPLVVVAHAVTRSAAAIESVTSRFMTASISIDSELQRSTSHMWFLTASVRASKEIELEAKCQP